MCAGLLTNESLHLYLCDIRICTCFRVCISIFMKVCIFFIYIRICICIYMGVCICIFMRVCISIYMMRVCICIYIRVCICIYRKARTIPAITYYCPQVALLPGQTAQHLHKVSLSIFLYFQFFCFCIVLTIHKHRPTRAYKALMWSSYNLMTFVDFVTSTFLFWSRRRRQNKELCRRDILWQEKCFRSFFSSRNCTKILAGNFCKQQI